MSFKMTFNGKPFNANTFAKELERGVATIVKRKLPEHLAENLQDPVTGEKPTISIAKDVEQLSDLDGLKVKVSGLPELIAGISKQLAEDDK